MLELLPRDHAPLDPDEIAVLSHVYDLFEQEGGPVSGRRVVYDLRDSVHQARRILVDRLRDYVDQFDEDQYVPVLRAALRLWREQDLRTVDEFYEYLRKTYRPDRFEISSAELQSNFGDTRNLKRLKHLIRRENFGRLELDPPAGRPPVTINESILEAPTLGDYLMQRYGHKIEVPSSPFLPALAVRLSGFAISNFRSLRCVRMPELGKLTALVGRNDAGKSNLVKALRFASVAAREGVATAIRQERGLQSLIWRGTNRESVASIELTLLIDERDNLIPGRYLIDVDQDPKTPVSRELLEKTGASGTGVLVDQKRNATSIRSDSGQSRSVGLARGESALSTLSDLSSFREAMSIREGLGSWMFFDLTPSHIREGRPWPTTAREDQKRFPLYDDGANLTEALNEFGKQYPQKLEDLAADFRDLIPTAEKLSSTVGLDGRAVILLSEKGFTDPFTTVDFSDGMLRILALLFIAHHPEPPSLVCIEEPENGLYPRLIQAMLEVLRDLAERTQVVITTHSVTLLDRMDADEVVFVDRNEDNSTRIERLDSREDVKKFRDRFGIGEQIRMGQVEDK